MIPEEVKAQIKPAKSALVLIDLQRRHMDPKVGYHLVHASMIEGVKNSAIKALAAARAANMPVIHVHAFGRQPSPWGLVDHHNPFLDYQTGKMIPGMGAKRQSGKNLEGSIYAEPLPELAPVNGEPVVVKRRYSGFHQTDLELILRNMGIETLFVCGVNTNNCVLATTYDGFMRDFRMVVLADCCGSMNGEEYHKFALMEVEAALGFVSSSDELAAFLASAPVAKA